MEIQCVLNFGTVNPIPYMIKFKKGGKIGGDIDGKLCDKTIFMGKTRIAKKREKDNMSKERFPQGLVN